MFVSTAIRQVEKMICTFSCLTLVVVRRTRKILVECMVVIAEDGGHQEVVVVFFVIVLVCSSLSKRKIFIALSTNANKSLLRRRSLTKESNSVPSKDA